MRRELVLKTYRGHIDAGGRYGRREDKEETCARLSECLPTARHSIVCRRREAIPHGTEIGLDPNAMSLCKHCKHRPLIVYPRARCDALLF